MADSQRRLVRFGPFVADLETGELRKDRVKLKISGQPFQVLASLLERAGEVVTREELQKRLWPDTFVDVDHNLNTAVNKIREALGDSAESPRYVETLPRRGYRFIAPVLNIDLTTPQRPAEEVAKPPFRSRREKWIHLGVGVLSATVLATVLWRLAVPAKSSPRVIGFRQITQDGQGKGWMSTDGARIYFNEAMSGSGTMRGPYQVEVNGGEVTPFPVSIKQPVYLDLSADGTELLLKSNADNSLWIQPVTGGSPRPVTGRAAYAGFLGKSNTVIYGDGPGVYSISREGQTPHMLFSMSDDSVPFYFRIAPDGKTLRFSRRNIRNGTYEIFEASTDGTPPHKVLSGSCGEWTRDGRYFVFNDPVSGQIALQSWPLSKGFWSRHADLPTRLSFGPLDFANPLPARDGKEIYVVGTKHRAEVMRYDSRNGEFVPFFAGISAQGLAFSKDGQWVTYSSFPDGSLWRSKIDGSERLQLTFPPTRTMLPRWSPDGTQIAYSALSPGANLNVYLIPSNGGVPRRILASEQSQVDVNWSWDGKSLLFASQQIPGAHISIFDLKTNTVSTLPASVGLFSPHWSPDGRYIVANHTVGLGAVLFDFSTQQWTDLTDMGVDNATWSHDGAAVYFESGDGPEKKIERISIRDRKVSFVASFSDLHRPTDGDYFWGWTGLSPDDAPLVARDISSQELYALQIEWH